MSSLAEIQEAIEKLAPEERAELWDWFQAQEVEETDEMLAAVDEGIRSIEERGGIPAEEVRKLIPKWITK
jgi:TRAP-type C4-dicarboxylate transport system substrate-binding protein